MKRSHSSVRCGWSTIRLGALASITTKPKMSWPVFCRYGSAKARNQDREHLIGTLGANGISLLFAKEDLGKDSKTAQDHPGMRHERVG
jgi:hypothetical protein